MIAVGLPGLPLDSVERAVDHWVGHRPVLRADRCTTARHERAGCRACQDACPTGALRIDPQHRLVQIDPDTCTGCDACVGACPTGALASRAPKPRSGVVVCRPVAGTVPGASVVPCAASLSAATLLELATGGDVVVVVGDCDTCPTAGGSPVAERVAAVDRTMAALGSTRRVTVRRPGAEPPAARLLPSDPPAPTTTTAPRRSAPVSRRAFFRFAGLGMRETVGAALDAGDEPDVLGWADPARDAQTSGAGAALATLAAQAGTGSSVVDTAGIGVGTPTLHGDCDLCGACAAFCPTTALRLVADGPASTLDVDVAACTACGLCEAICPRQALHVTTTVSVDDLHGDRRALRRGQPREPGARMGPITTAAAFAAHLPPPAGARHQGVPA